MGEHYVQPPLAYAEFCSRYAQECRIQAREPAVVQYTAELQRKMEAVNTSVNGKLTAVTDDEQWGEGADHWDIPESGPADCEDFALRKRRVLSMMGVPHRAMRMTFVWAKGYDGKRSGHAVLSVMTSRGPYVLDVLSPDVVPPEKLTQYEFNSRESSERGGWWVTY